MDTPLCRTRRTWLPNAQRVSLYSPTLQRTLKLRVSAAALRWAEVLRIWSAWLAGPWPREGLLMLESSFRSSSQ